MRYQLLTAGLLSLASTIVNGASTSHVEPVENLKRVPEGWIEHGAPEQSRRLYFRVAVHQPEEAHELFERTLIDISTPGNPRYGQHLKREELQHLVRPRAESTDAVLKWLQESGIAQEDIENDGQWINFYAPVATAEKMMSAKFKTYQNLVRKDVRKIRALQYSVPKEVRDHVDMIQPTTYFGQMREQSSQVHNVMVVESANSAKFRTANMASAATANAVNATCARVITPSCLAELYNFKDFVANHNVSTTVGVSGFLEQYARYDDFERFAQLWAPNAVGSNFTWTSVNGGINDQSSPNNSVEANLDTQYTAGLIAPHIKTNYYSTPGRGPLIPEIDQPTQDDNQNEPYLEYFTYLVRLADDELPDVLTTSYGEDEQSVPASYAKKVCDLIGQLGTRGVSVIFSSGDTGVGSSCQTNDGRNATRFLPIFPASCPYVTSVGGTTRIEPEEAIYFSSGGFSDIWKRPRWQEAAVTSYLSKLGSQWEGLYNPRGRGFPDVAAQGQSFRVVDKGVTISVGGTSASAPVFASIIAMLNNKRGGEGKSRLGFLNPWIYSQGYKGLNDITKGGSSGCTGRSIYSGLPGPYVRGASWNATEGWDPVTGMGTPDFGKMLATLENGGQGGRGQKVGGNQEAKARTYEGPRRATRGN